MIQSPYFQIKFFPYEKYRKFRELKTNYQIDDLNAISKIKNDMETKIESEKDSSLSSSKRISIYV